jgi:hypothetical protein
MTYYAFYEVIKFWLPFVTIIGLAVKAWQRTCLGVTAFFDALLNNHLHTIESNTATSAALLSEVRDDQRTGFLLLRSDMKAVADSLVKADANRRHRL